MIQLQPVTLEGHGVRLEPLAMDPHDDLVAEARDGELWSLFFTFVPEPGDTKRYSVRDTVMYSILASEWPGVRKHLETRLWRHSP